MKYMIYNCSISMLLSFVFVATAISEDKNIDARGIAEKTLNAYYYAQNDSISKVHFRLINKDGKERIKEFTMLRLDIKDCGEQYYFTYFYNPPDIRRTVFMVRKNIDRDDDRWLYLPAIDLVRRISSSDKQSSFVGSDFSYEDISGRHLDDDEYQFIKEEIINGRKTSLIKYTPKDKDGVKYSYRMIWTEKKTSLPVRLEYYDKHEKLYKVMEAKKIELIKDTPTITMAVMKNLKTGHSTEITVKKIDYNTGLPKDIFKERYLRNAPRKWINSE